MAHKHIPGRREFVSSLLFLGALVSVEEMAMRAKTGSSLITWISKKIHAFNLRRDPHYRVGPGKNGETVYSHLSYLNPIVVKTDEDYETGIANNEFVFYMGYRENQTAREFAQLVSEVAPDFPEVKIMLERNDEQRYLGVEYLAYKAGQEVENGFVAVNKWRVESTRVALQETLFDLVKDTEKHYPSPLELPGVPV